MTPEQIASLKAALEAKVAEGLISLASANKSLEETIKNMGIQIDAVKSKLAVSLPGVDLGTKDSEKFSFLRVFTGLKTGNWKHAGFEKEIMDQTQEKALSAGSGSTGGFIVPVEFSRQLIELFYAQSVVMKMGASRINPTGIPFEMPKMIGGASAAWADEGATISESQPAFGKISMTPKYLTALVPMSDRLIAYSDPAAEALVRKDIVRALDLKLDFGCLYGDGTLSSPVGIVNQEGINTLEVGANGDDPTYDFMIDMEGQVEDANALDGELGFISNPAVFRKIRKQKVAQYAGQTDGNPLFQPIMTKDQLTGAIGKWASSTQVSKTRAKGSATTLSSLIYGNWAELLVAVWGSLVLKSSDQVYFKQNITCLKAVMEADCALRHAKSFSYAPYVTTI